MSKTTIIFFTTIMLIFEFARQLKFEETIGLLLPIVIIIQIGYSLFIN